MPAGFVTAAGTATPRINGKSCRGALDIRGSALYAASKPISPLHWPR
jgi:hypothetical protein